MPEARLKLVENVAPVEAVSPRHLAIVMDGNHRWARRRHLPGSAGHRAGAKNVKVIAQACADRGVECLTLFALSTENWKRPRREVNLLLELARGVLKDDIEELNERGARLRFVGQREQLPEDLQRLMASAERRTEANERLHLTIAINYGGRWDIVHAAQALAQAVKDGDISADDIDEASFASQLALSDLPAPDLCIRTGGDQRISNFLLWDFAYTEFYFSPHYWPDFNDEKLAQAFADYGARQRRYGRRLSA